jgi:hypothetical protein
VPLFATELGDASVQGHRRAPDDCDAKAEAERLDWLDRHQVSWTAWAWLVDDAGCGFPTLLKDWSGRPNPVGAVVREALRRR